jgi:hypothetical protein
MREREMRDFIVVDGAQNKREGEKKNVDFHRREK